MVKLLFCCVFLPLEAYWVFGPHWAWMIYSAAWILVAIFALSNKSIKPEPRLSHPPLADGIATLIMLNQWTQLAVAIGVIAKQPKWQLALCAFFFIAGSMIWPRYSSQTAHKFW